MFLPQRNFVSFGMFELEGSLEVLRHKASPLLWNEVSPRKALSQLKARGFWSRLHSTGLISQLGFKDGGHKAEVWVFVMDSGLNALAWTSKTYFEGWWIMATWKLRTRMVTGLYHCDQKMKKCWSAENKHFLSILGTGYRLQHRHTL